MEISNFFHFFYFFFAFKTMKRKIRIFRQSPKSFFFVSFHYVLFMSSLLTVETWNEFLWKPKEKKKIFNIKTEFFTRTFPLFATDLTDNWNNIELRVILFLLLRSSILLFFDFGLLHLHLSFSVSLFGSFLTHLFPNRTLHKSLLRSRTPTHPTTIAQLPTLANFVRLAYDSIGMHHHYFYVLAKKSSFSHRQTTFFSGLRTKIWFTTRVGSRGGVERRKNCFSASPDEHGIFMLSLRSAVDVRLTHVNIFHHQPSESVVCCCGCCCRCFGMKNSSFLVHLTQA